MKLHFVAPQFIVMDAIQARNLDPLRITGLKFKRGTPEEKRVYCSLLVAWTYFQSERFIPREQRTHNVKQLDNRVDVIYWNDFTAMLNERMNERG